MEERDPKQGKVTEENKEEARRIKAIWDETEGRRAEDGAGTQLAFGEKYDIGSQGAVGFFLNGKTALSLKAAVGFAAGMYCRVYTLPTASRAANPGIAGRVAPRGCRKWHECVRAGRRCRHRR